MCYLLKTQKQYVSVSYSKNQSDETVSMTPEQTWSAEENQKLQEKSCPWGFLGVFAQWICFRRNDRFKTSKFTALKKREWKMLLWGSLSGQSGMMKACLCCWNTRKRVCLFKRKRKWWQNSCEWFVLVYTKWQPLGLKNEENLEVPKAAIPEELIPTDFHVKAHRFETEMPP